MTRLLFVLRRRRDGLAAVEFALALPILVMLLAGIAQMGALFAANAGLQQAVGEAARLATIYPQPTDTVLIARVRAAAFSLNTTYLDAPVVTRGTSNGVPYVDISLTYRPPLKFVFFTVPAITMTRTRRAYLN